MKSNIHNGTIANCSYLCRVPSVRNSMSRRKRRPPRRKYNLPGLVKKLKPIMSSPHLLDGACAIYGIAGYYDKNEVKIVHLKLNEPGKLQVLRRIRKEFPISPLLILVVYPNGHTSYEVIGQEVKGKVEQVIDTELIKFLKQQWIDDEILEDAKSVYLVAAYTNENGEVKLTHTFSANDISSIKEQYPNCAFRVIITYQNGSTHAENFEIENCSLEKKTDLEDCFRDAKRQYQNEPCYMNAVDF